MEYYIFVLDNQIIGAGQAHLLNDDIIEVTVSEEVYNAYNNDNRSMIWDEETEDIIPNPQYEELLAQEREEEFHVNFFHTSLGYIRRKVHMKDGSIKDFISDLIPLMENTPGIPIIAYGTPDFTKEITEEILIGLQTIVNTTPEFIKECKDQAIVDFYGYNPLELLMMQQGEPEVIEPEVTEPSEEPTEEPVEEEPTEEPVEEELEEPIIEPFEEIQPLDSEEELDNEEE